MKQIAVSPGPDGPHRRALVTGASEGLGRVFTKKLAHAGYHCVAVARNEARLRELVDELPAGNHEWMVADLGTTDGVAQCATRLSEEHFDLLVNNAGFSRFGLFHESTAAEQEQMLDVDCRAVLLLAHAFLTSARPGDALINLSSITNFLPTPIQPTYCAAKAFIASLSESLWYQQRSRGVYVQGLCPGVTLTRFVERAGEVRIKSILDALSQSPEAVVDASLHALARRRRPIVVPGLHNRLVVLATKLLPRRALVLASGHLGDLA